MNNLVQELAEDLLTLRTTRTNMLRLLKPFSLEQLNHIPAGFNNNLAWNAGHCWITQKLLTYSLSGQDTGMSSELLATYRKGSKPSGDLSAAEWDVLVEGLTTSVDALEHDLENLTWDEHTPYTTSYGVTIQHVRKGVRFNNVHEGMHYGTMLALSKLV